MFASLFAKIAGSAVVGLITKGLLYLGIYWAGKKAQHSADVEAAQKEDIDARKIDDAISRLSDDELNKRLQQSSRNP